MKTGDRGTRSHPWICFSEDHTTGASYVDRGMVWIFEGKSMEFNEWASKLHEAGHIDAMMKWAAIASVSGGSSAIGRMLTKFGIRRAK